MSGYEILFLIWLGCVLILFVGWKWPLLFPLWVISLSGFATMILAIILLLLNYAGYNQCNYHQHLENS